MQSEAFSDWLDTQPVNENTRDMRIRALLRVERAYELDLDDAYASDGLQSLLQNFRYSREDTRQGLANPTKMNIETGDIRSQVSWYRTQINSYRKFRIEAANGISAAESDDDGGADALTFGLEADLEAALLGNLAQLEPGLTLAPGGQQYRCASGIIDILATDRAGKPLIIELKAGTTRPDAVAQILGYMGDIAETTGQPVRGLLIGADHHARVEAAARAVPNLQLRRYSYQFSFT